MTEVTILSYRLWMSIIGTLILGFGSGYIYGKNGIKGFFIEDDDDYDYEEEED